jgi:hypothetical protein
MNKATLNHHKAHKPLQWRTGAWSPRAGATLPGFRHRPAAGGVGHGGDASAERRSRDRAFPPRRESLNWTLRRYVRASSLRVWLRRQAPEAGGAPVPAGRGGLLRAVALRTGTAGKTGSPVPVERVNGGSLSMDHALRYRVHRNRQMEHLTQVAASLRGGVRRGAAITTRERSVAWDLVLTTLSNKTSVQSNIFGFVMT